MPDQASMPLPTSVPSLRGQRLYLPMTMLYASYGLVLGFVQSGIAPVLVARGVPVEQVGLTILLFLPLGLAFLWSPFIERLRLPALPHATGWIIAAQTVAAVLLVVIGMLEGAPLQALLFVGLGVTVAMATMDVQFEGLVVTLVPKAGRPAAAAIKLATFTGGAILGGGVLVGLFDALGWMYTFLVIAALLMLSVWSTTLLPLRGFVPAPAPRIDLRAIFGRPLFLRRLFSAAFFLASLYLLFGLNRVALVQIGLPLERVGWLVGTLGPLLAMPVIGLAGLAITRFGSRRVLDILIVLGVGCGMVWAVAASLQATTVAVLATLAGGTVLAGAYVVLLGALLAWSAGERPATDYAVFYGFGNLAAMVPMAGAGLLAGVIGWTGYYSLAAILFALGAANLRLTLRDRSSDQATRNSRRSAS